MTISEVSAPTNPVYIPHGDASAGFILPDYTTSQNVGCPVTSIVLSTTSWSNSPPTDVTLVDDDNGDKRVRAYAYTSHF